MERGRTFLYRKDCPGGQIFIGDEEINQKLREGWQEAPYPELLNGVSEPLPENQESPSGSEPLKPWQKAQAARKAKKAGGK